MNRTALSLVILLTCCCTGCYLNIANGIIEYRNDSFGGIEYERQADQRIGEETKTTKTNFSTSGKSDDSPRP